MCYFLSPTTNIAGQFRDCFGLFETIGSNRNLSDISVWGMDNGRFSNAWTEDRWLKMLSYYSEEDKNKCVFSAVPDVLFDAKNTICWFHQYAPIVKKFGYPVALVTQDGMTPEMVPWGETDALFLGGSDHHKRGPEAARLAVEAKRQDKWVHVGRVNSGATIEKYFWWADSWDGRTLTIKPSQQYESIGRAVRNVRLKKRQCLLI